jgi:hypothetical protein
LELEFLVGAKRSVFPQKSPRGTPCCVCLGGTIGKGKSISCVSPLPVQRRATKAQATNGNSFEPKKQSAPRTAKVTCTTHQ